MKVKNSPLLNFSIPGYKFINENSLTNTGGVGVHVSEVFHYEIITFDFQFCGCKQLWIRINCLNSDFVYVIGTIYRHPSTNASDFIKFLNNIISQLNASKMYYFVLGDININISTSPTKSVNEYLNMFNSNFVASIINVFIRVTEISSTTLDHILTNENRYQPTLNVVDYDLSDYYSIMVIVSNKLKTSCDDDKSIFKRSFAEFSPVNLNQELHDRLNDFLFKNVTIN